MIRRFFHRPASVVAPWASISVLVRGAGQRVLQALLPWDYPGELHLWGAEKMGAVRPLLAPLHSVCKAAAHLSTLAPAVELKAPDSS